MRHGRVDLALHELREGSGPRLLVLHELGGCADDLDVDLGAWPGAVFALDFTGHGASSRPRGGGYTGEVLMADADAALAALGEATLLGFGLGAWIALLLAGGRPGEVRGAVLGDGRGLDGGGPTGAPTDPFVAGLDTPGTVDRYALHELSRDARPPDYAELFARQAAGLSRLENAVSVVARARPPWLAAALGVAGVVESGLAEALERYATGVVNPCVGAP
jgi:pimeloyl-ACP methyl ester carboxylesterase